VERNRIFSLQSHGKTLEKECCLPGVFGGSDDTPANLLCELNGHLMPCTSYQLSLWQMGRRCVCWPIWSIYLSCCCLRNAKLLLMMTLMTTVLLLLLGEWRVLRDDKRRGHSRSDSRQLSRGQTAVTHTHTHTRTHARTHAHTHTLSLSLSLSLRSSYHQVVSQIVLDASYCYRCPLVCLCARAKHMGTCVPIQLAQCWFPGLAISNDKV